MSFKIQLPHKLVIHGFGYGLDGGTITLHTKDESGNEHKILSAQIMFPESRMISNALPGRLYFDDDLISIRSETEGELLALLRGADIKLPSKNAEVNGQSVFSDAFTISADIKEVIHRKPAENIRVLRDQLIAWVESHDYISLAQEIEKIHGKI